jgi:hypothetical protein
MKSEEVVTKLRAMKVEYANDRIGSNPALLPDHVTDFEAYVGILYSHYAEFMLNYREVEAQVLADEGGKMAEMNSIAKNREERRTADEKNDRITIRMASLKGKREWYEAELKGATLHINTIQSKMKRQADEAKGGIL